VAYQQGRSEFVVGVDDFARLEIRDSGKNGFYYFFDKPGGRLIKQFVLEIRPRVVTLCDVVLIAKDDRFTPRLRLWKRDESRKAKDSTAEVEPRTVKSVVSLGECHDAFWDLITFLQSVKEVDVPRTPFSMVQGTDHAFLQKVLTTFNTPDMQRLLIQAKQDDVRNLYAAVRHAKNKSALDEFRQLIYRDARELEFQAWFQANTWAFGVEYLHIYATSRIGIHSDSDFIAQSLDEYHDLVELKRPSMVLLTFDASHSNWYASSELSKAIGQAAAYLHAMERSRAELLDEDGITVLKPRIKIIAGLTSDFDEPRRRALRLLNNSLHGIEIISYDQVDARAQRFIDAYSTEEPGLVS